MGSISQCLDGEDIIILRTSSSEASEKESNVGTVESGVV